MAKNKDLKSNAYRNEEILRRRLHKLFEASNVPVSSENSAMQTSANQQQLENINRKNSKSPTRSSMNSSYSGYKKSPINISNSFKAERKKKPNNFKIHKSIKTYDNHSKNSKTTNRQERNSKSSQVNFTSKCSQEKRISENTPEDQSNVPEFSKRAPRKPDSFAQLPPDRRTRQWENGAETKTVQPAVEGKIRLKQERSKKASSENKKNNQHCKNPEKMKKRRYEQENQCGKKPRTEESTSILKDNKLTTNLSEDLYDNGNSHSEEFSSSEYSFSGFVSAALSDYSNEESYYSTGDEESIFSFSDDSFYEYENYINEESLNNRGEDYHVRFEESDDVVVHRGTADKRNLMPCDGVVFNSDVDDAQVIELEEQNSFQKIRQPEEYQRSALEELSSKEVSTAPLHLQLNHKITNTEDCPQLVPALSDYCTNYYESCEDILEDSNESSISILSGDVNEKYLHLDGDEGININNESHKQRVVMSAVVIEASNSVNVIIPNENSLKNDKQSRSNVADLLPSELLISELDLDATNEAVVLTEDVSKLPTNPLSENSDTISKKNAPVNKEIAGSIGEECNSGISSSPLNHYVKNGNNSSIFCNSIDSNHVLVLLRAPIYLYGTVKFTAILGSIRIYGYQPHYGEELEIFSPRGLCSVQITNKSNGKITHKIISNKLKMLENCFSKVDLQNIENNYSPQGDALILLKPNDQRKKLLKTLKKYMNENLFPHTNIAQTERAHFISECRLSCFINLDDETRKSFKVNPQWNQLILDSHSKLMIIGGKSVGKSTLLRYLVNRNLSAYPRILLIDLDIGQPEIFVPQTISATLLDRPLLGPGYFLNCQPRKAYAVGYSNIVMCPHRYMLAVKELLCVCRTNEEFRQLPWVINTMGYNRGFGAELIAVICELLQPTNVVQLQSNKDINNFDYIMEPSVVSQIARNIFVGEEYRAPEGSRSLTYKLHTINSVILQESRFNREWEMSAKDVRYAILLARLSDALDCQAEWLTDCSPLSASLENFKIISLISGDYTWEQLLKSVEANLVYLCRYQNEHIVECFGIGVVRAIDYHTNQIYLLPAIPHDVMPEVDCLAIGDMPLPTSMLTNQGPKAKNIAPFVYNAIEDNATKSIKQVYFRPMEFLKGKHQYNLCSS